MSSEVAGPRLLRRVLLRHRWQLALAALLYAVHEIGEALVPVTIGLVIDHAVDGGPPTALLGWLAVLAGVFVLLSLTYRFGARASTRVKQAGGHRLRVALARRVLDPAGGADRGRHPGWLVAVASSDTKRVGDFAGLVALSVSAVAALLLVLLGAPVLLVVTHLASRRLRARSTDEQEAGARTAALATDLVSGLRVLHGIGAAAPATERYRASSATARDRAVAAASTAATLDALAVLLNGCYLAAIAFLGGRLALSHTITPGQLVSALGLAQYLLGPLRGLATMTTAYARATASATRVATVEDSPPALTPPALTPPALTPPAPTSPAVPALGDGTPGGLGGLGGPGGPGAGEPGAVPGDLRFEGFSAGGVTGLELAVPAGGLTGVVMADPGGLLACLARATDPERGRILLDGADLAGLDPGAVREVLVVSGEHAPLLSGTVRDNVAARAASDRAVDDAMATATVTELVTALPDGEDTDVGESGNRLSGGQRQRVALARALATGAPVLVLHEPTSAVDSVTEAAIATALAALRGPRTTVVFTTSPTLLSACDRVITADPADLTDPADPISPAGSSGLGCPAGPAGLAGPGGGGGLGDPVGGAADVEVRR